MPTHVHSHGHHRTAQRLREIHDVVLAGDSTVVLVSAPDGGGKSHLIDSVFARTSGVTSAIVRALPWEIEIPWVTVDRILERLPAPDSDSGSGSGSGSDSMGSERTATTVVEALTAAISAAGSGTVIVIDDADQADIDSLRALGSALESAVDGSVLLVLTSQTPSSGTSADMCDTLAREKIRLGSLDHVEIRALAAARTGREPSAAAARQILEYTGGDAGAVTTIVDEAPESWWTSPFMPPPLPASVELDTAEQLARLKPEERYLVEAAAVLAQPVLLNTLSKLITATNEGQEMERGSLLAALDVAHHAGIFRVALSPGTATITFRSPLIRTAVLRGIPPSGRVTLHTAAARLVADTDPDASLEHLAWIAPGPDPELCRRLLDRAEVHANAGHWSAAGHAFLTAAALTPDPEEARRINIDGIDALIGAGRISEAATLSRLLDRVLPDPRRDAVLGSLALHLGHAGEAETLLRRALEGNGFVDDQGTASTEDLTPDTISLAQKFVLHSLCEWQPDQLRRWAGVITGSARPNQPEVEEARAIALLGNAIESGPSTGAQDDGRPSGLAPAVAQRFEMASGWIALANDDLETALHRLGSAVPTADVSGSARISLWSQAWLARTYLLHGDWDDALRVVDTAARRIDDLELELLAPVVHWSGAIIRSMRGDRLGASAHLRRLTATTDAYPMQVIPSALGRMQIAAAAGDYSSVRKAAEPLRDLSLRIDIDQPGFWPWHDLYAHSLVLAGRLDEAEQLIAQPEQRAMDTGHRSTLARLGAVRSRIAAVRGDVDECSRIFHQSIEHLDGLTMPYVEARMQFGFGQTLRRAGRRREAHLALGTARDLYEQLGAHAYVERCDRERRAGGVDVARTGGNATLTPQEQAVATLVAAGRSNAQAAEELFLSVKTIQYHLTRIYSKLGVSGRTELAVHASRSRHPFGPDHSTPGVT